MPISNKLSTKKKIYKHYASELSIQTKFIKGLKQRNPEAFIVKLSDKWISGLPDVLMVKNGHAIFFELKSKNGFLSEIQKQTLKAIENAGGLTQIIRGGE